MGKKKAGGATAAAATVAQDAAEGGGYPDSSPAASQPAPAAEEATLSTAEGGGDESAAQPNGVETIGAEEDADEDEGGGVAPDAAGKKKRRNKKKAKDSEPVPERATDSADATAAEGASSVVEAAAAPAEAKGAEDSEGSDEDGGEADGAAKKKKKKKKKKHVLSTALAVAGDGAAGGPRSGVVKYVTDEVWEPWVEAALKATAGSLEKISAEDRLKPPQAFWGYKYTGNLRPALVTPQMRMPASTLMPDYATHSDGHSLCEREGPKEVPVLEGKDLQTMREACRLGREVLDIAARYMRVGVTGDEIDRVVYQACVDRKIYPSPLNYYRFPKSVCVSPNEVICHGIPDCRPIEDGDIVNLDVSIYHKGFHSDLNETFFVGDCGEEAHRVVRTAYCALHAASQLIRPGTLYRDLGNVIGVEASKNNCAVVLTYCGHGVGRLFHGPPKVPHYKKNKAVGLMKPGHIFTVEPMINIGTSGADKTWPDNWTAVTKDGKLSAQFEHTFLVTETGVDVLTGRAGVSPHSMPPWDPSMFQL
jgi:methionyl aminopeptidase